MKDDKELNGLNLSDEVSEVIDKTAVTEDNFSNAIDKSQDYSDKVLADELERLAQTFQTELKKAQAMSEEELIKNGIIIQQYEDDDGVIPEEELCQCCGEQRRDKTFGERYEYCRNCREAMKRYPLSIPGIITLAAMVFVAVVSLFSFGADFSLYNTVRKGDEYVKENKLNSAFDSYDSAISLFSEKGIVAENLYYKTIDIIYQTMPDGMYSMTEMKGRMEAVLSGLESKLPLYSNRLAQYYEIQGVIGTINEVYTIINNEKYAEYDLDKQEQYEEVMTAIGSVVDKNITVTSVDKKTSQIVDANQAIVRFFQYTFAYSVGHYDDAYQYMKMVYELEPSYVWLYAYELGMTEIQKGNVEEAENLAEVLHKTNAESAEAYILKSAIYRLTGDTKKAIVWADNGVETVSDNAELYRMQAMAYIAEGDYEKAKKATDAAMEYDRYGLLYMVAIVAENELGNSEKVKEYKEELEKNNVELSEKMQKYLKGKISAQQMFTEGTGDVE